MVSCSLPLSNAAFISEPKLNTKYHKRALSWEASKWNWTQLLAKLLIMLQLPETTETRQVSCKDEQFHLQVSACHISCAWSSKAISKCRQTGSSCHLSPQLPVDNRVPGTAFLPCFKQANDSVTGTAKTRTVTAVSYCLKAAVNVAPQELP